MSFAPSPLPDRSEMRETRRKKPATADGDRLLTSDALTSDALAKDT
jgi:hypothetical protein